VALAPDPAAQLVQGLCAALFYPPPLRFLPRQLDLEAVRGRLAALRARLLRLIPLVQVLSLVFIPFVMRVLVPLVALGRELYVDGHFAGAAGHTSLVPESLDGQERPLQDALVVFKELGHRLNRQGESPDLAPVELPRL